MAKNTVMQTPDVNAATKGGTIDFRRATVERSEILPAESNLITTSTIRIERTVEGTGYVFGIVLNVAAPASANSVANVTFTEDAPWSALDTVVFRDVNGELLNLTGFDLFLANLGQKQYAFRFQDASALFNTIAGGGATSGTFNFWIRIPIALNRRSLSGLIGNQDRSQKYSVRTDQAGSGAIYTTVPTTNPTMAINKQYENYAVPLATNPDNMKQERAPRDFGLLHYLTSLQSAEAPAPSASVNHFLRRVGLSIRFIIFVFRAGSGAIPRSVAQTSANQPTGIRFKIGDDTLFNEAYNYRRYLMFERYGFDWPDGVLIYDAMHDLVVGAGSEVGDDYYQTQGLVNSQLQVTYPSGFSSGGTLRIITDDLAFVAPVAA